MSPKTRRQSQGNDRGVKRRLDNQEVENRKKLKLGGRKGASGFSCRICGKSCRQRSHLLVHMKKHNQECQECGDSFGSLEEKRLHQRVVHEGGRPIICEWCPEQFSSVTFYQKHYRLEHKNLKSRRKVGRPRKVVVQGDLGVNEERSGNRKLRKTQDKENKKVLVKRAGFRKKPEEDEFVKKSEFELGMRRPAKTLPLSDQAFNSVQEKEKLMEISLKVFETLRKIPEGKMMVKRGKRLTRKEADVEPSETNPVAQMMEKRWKLRPRKSLLVAKKMPNLRAYKTKINRGREMIRKKRDAQEVVAKRPRGRPRKNPDTVSLDAVGAKRDTVKESIPIVLKDIGIKLKRCRVNLEVNPELDKRAKEMRPTVTPEENHEETSHQVKQTDQDSRNEKESSPKESSLQKPEPPKPFSSSSGDWTGLLDGIIAGVCAPNPEHPEEILENQRVPVPAAPPAPENPNYVVIVHVDPVTKKITPFPSPSVAQPPENLAGPPPHPPNLWFSVNGKLMMPMLSVQQLRERQLNFIAEKAKKRIEAVAKSKSRKARKYTKPSFKCPTCGQTFETGCSFEKHLRIHSTKMRNGCPLCKKRFPSKRNAIFHVIQSHYRSRTNEISSCPLCTTSQTQTSSANFSGMYQHLDCATHEDEFIMRD